MELDSAAVVSRVLMKSTEITAVSTMYVFFIMLETACTSWNFLLREPQH